MQCSDVCVRWDVAVQFITTDMRCEYLLSVCQQVSGCSAALYGAEWSVKSQNARCESEVALDACLGEKVSLKGFFE